MRALLLLALCACGAEVRSPDAPTEAAEQSVGLGPLFVPTLEGTFFDLGLQMESKPPSWLAQRMQRPLPADLVTDDPVIGARHALLHTTIGWFMTSNAGLVAGPLPFPEQTRWVGLDGRDGVYVATESGSLFHVGQPELAYAWHRYAARAQVSGARSWDAAGRFVVALGAPPALRDSAGSPAPLIELWVSADYGRQFQRRALPGEVAVEIIVRADGFMYVSVVSPQSEAADGSAPLTPKAFVSADAGVTWRPFPRPASGLQRLGGMLYGSDDDGAAYLITRAGTAAPLATIPCIQRWSGRLSLWSTVSPEPELCFEVDAAAPESGAANDRRESACTCDHPSISRGMRRSSWLGEGFFRPDERFQPPQARTRFGMLDVSTCASRDSISSDHAAAPRGCKDDAAWLAKPIVAVRDQLRDRISFVKLPDGLWARSVLDAGGMGVVLARAETGEARLFTLDDEGKLYPESQVPFDSGSLLRAEDGTLVLIGQGPRLGALAFVRSPLELGAPNAWRDVSVERAVSYLPLTAGRVLVGSEAESNRGVLLFSVDEPAGRRSLTRVAGDRQNGQLAFDGQHLFLQAKPNAEWYAVAPDGRLVVSSSCFISGSCAPHEE